MKTNIIYYFKLAEAFSKSLSSLPYRSILSESIYSGFVEYCSERARENRFKEVLYREHIDSCSSPISDAAWHRISGLSRNTTYVPIIRE